jgi:hypothetical protein
MPKEGKKIIGVVITDGVGYRNFILSHFIEQAKRTFDEVIVFSCLPKSAYEGLILDCTIVELAVFEESFFTWFFRKSKELAHLQLHAKGNFGIQSNLEKNKTTSKTVRGFSTRFLFFWTRYFNSESWIQAYNTIQQTSFSNREVTHQYGALLKDFKIDLLFFTHQRPPYIAPLIYAAEKLKIKTATFIFSWDNLASKGRMAGNFNYYLVWSDLMKKELNHFYKSINQDQIEVVGTPQFEPYVMEGYEINKERYLSQFKLEKEIPTLFFSCGDVSTSKNDPLYVEMIAKAILESKLIKDVNLLVRTSPAEEPTRFAAIKEKYPFICWNYPDWKLTRSNHQEDWSQRIPSVQDVNDLKSILAFCDVNINMLSTMSLDAMIFGKPVINTVFGNKENGWYTDQRFLKYKHIEHVLQSNAVVIATNENELIIAINQCLQTPKYKELEQKRLLDVEISKPILGTSARIAEALKGMCG